MTAEYLLVTNCFLRMENFSAVKMCLPPCSKSSTTFNQNELKQYLIAHGPSRPSPSLLSLPDLPIACIRHCGHVTAYTSSVPTISFPGGGCVIINKQSILVHSFANRQFYWLLFQPNLRSNLFLLSRVFRGGGN
jgi:hypothetical protein